VLVGPNNIGKTAVVDALRALLAGADDPYPRFDKDDIHIPKSGTPATEIRFEYVFRELGLDDEADFLHALRKNPDGTIEAVLGVSYGEMDKRGYVCRADKGQIRNMLDGTTTEVGRIGYVAVTRARNPFVLAVPESCIDDLVSELVACGFLKAGAS
jgi:predicted ATP-dependent endonuclease of OLD family